MMDPLLAGRLAVAQAEIAKARSLRARVETHGSRMSADAREIVWALVFAHEDAAEDLLGAAPTPGGRSKSPKTFA